jgi:hypothetical protein
MGMPRSRPDFKFPVCGFYLDDQGLFQVFLTDPNDIKIELNFATGEAKDIQAAVMASGL